MTNFVKRGLFTLVACLMLTGCFGRIQPIYSVVNNPIPSSAQFLSVREIGDIVEMSAINRGWMVEEVEPDLYEVTYRKKTHKAVIEVSFDQTSYSIKYKDSADLFYNGANIHRNYNRWVKYLERDIQMNLQKAGMSR